MVYSLGRENLQVLRIYPRRCDRCFGRMLQGLLQMKLVVAFTPGFAKEVRNCNHPGIEREREGERESIQAWVGPWSATFISLYE